MEAKHGKYILAGLTVLCVLLICITSLKDSIMGPLCTDVGYSSISMQIEVNAVGTGIYNKLKGYGSPRDVLWESKKLRTQIVQFTEDNNRLQAEQFELDHLEEFYGLDQDYMQHDKAGARVIVRDSEKRFQVSHISKGSADGVTVDMGIVADGGLADIVTDVGANYAVVRSTVDNSNRVGAIELDSSYNCIVVGDLTLYEKGCLRLTDFSRDAALRDGGQIVTSSISTKFLPGILIGYVVDVPIDPGHLIQSGYLIPVADFNNLQGVPTTTDIKDTEETAAQ